MSSIIESAALNPVGFFCFFCTNRGCAELVAPVAAEQAGAIGATHSERTEMKSIITLMPNSLRRLELPQTPSDAL